MKKYSIQEYIEMLCRLTDHIPCQCDYMGRCDVCIANALKSDLHTGNIPCSVCGQFSNSNQTGEYACISCSIPTLHDDLPNEE